MRRSKAGGSFPRFLGIIDQRDCLDRAVRRPKAPALRPIHLPARAPWLIASSILDITLFGTLSTRGILIGAFADNHRSMRIRRGNRAGLLPGRVEGHAFQTPRHRLITCKLDYDSCPMIQFICKWILGVTVGEVRQVKAYGQSFIEKEKSSRSSYSAPSIMYWSIHFDL